MSSDQPTAPYGYCQCGCGEKTTVPTRNNAIHGRVKGVPIRYVRGHQGRRPLADRFWEKVNKDGPTPEHRPDLGPCWVWTGSLNRDGYGSIRIEGKTVGTHLAGYRLCGHEIPAGLELDHLCWNRACVNPAHLECVTHAENVRRAAAAGRMWSPGGPMSPERRAKAGRKCPPGCECARHEAASGASERKRRSDAAKARVRTGGRFQ